MIDHLEREEAQRPGQEQRGQHMKAATAGVVEGASEMNNQHKYLETKK
jgi:hypothetical protein